MKWNENRSCFNVNMGFNLLHCLKSNQVIMVPTMFLEGPNQHFTTNDCKNPIFWGIQAYDCSIRVHVRRQRVRGWTSTPDWLHLAEEKYISGVLTVINCHLTSTPSMGHVKTEKIELLWHQRSFLEWCADLCYERTWVVTFHSLSAYCQWFRKRGGPAPAKRCSDIHVHVAAITAPVREVKG